MAPLPFPFLLTKLSIPPRRTQWIERPRLLAQLELRPETALVSITAPAGFGKTTLLADWCHRLQLSGNVPVSAGWVTLDEGDNDPVRFFAYLIAGFANALGPGPDLAPAQEAVQSGLGTGWETALTYLINALVRSGQRSLVVLDDFHQIRAPAVHAGLSFLLEHLPPGCHLALGSRATPPLPLSRLRARGQIVELRMADLRFTPDEISQYLQQRDELALSAGQMARLAEISEGWAAGLQLAALAAGGRQSRSRSSERNTAADDLLEAIEAPQQEIISYLIDEVFLQQPASVQMFLLHTCLLDRMCAQLCDRIIEELGLPVKGYPARDGRLHDDPRVLPSRFSQEILEYLEEQNLFTQRIDPRGQWFRYHRLFAETLRLRLEREHPERISHLHREASRWFAGQGLFEEAIEHALAVPDAGLAAGLITQTLNDRLVRSETAGLQAWLRRLPKSTLEERPALLIARAWAMALERPTEKPILPDVEAEMLVLDTRLSIEPDTGQVSSLRGQVSAVLAFLSLAGREPARTIRLAEFALDRLPPGEPFWRSIAMRCLGEAQLWSGDFPGAAASIRQASELSLSIGYLSLGLSALNQVAGLQAASGDLQAAAGMFQAGLAMTADRGWQEHPYTGILHAGLGSLYLEWNRLEEAEAHFQRALELGKLGGDRMVAMSALPGLALLQLVRGDSPGALSGLDELEAQAGIPAGSPAASPFAALRARFLLLSGRLGEAMAWAEASGCHADDPVLEQRPAEYLVWVQVVAEAGRLDEARRCLERLAPAMQAAGWVSAQLDALLTLAAVLQAEENTKAALDCLKQALQLALPGGYIRSFFDRRPSIEGLLRAHSREIAPGPSGTSLADPAARSYLRRLLDAVKPGDPEPGVSNPGSLHPAAMVAGQLDDDLIETLSERELEVLRRVARGASNRDIARELVITLATVKSHLNHIMRKLQAQNRTEAVARARELGLL